VLVPGVTYLTSILITVAAHRYAPQLQVLP